MKKRIDFDQELSSINKKLEQNSIENEHELGIPKKKSVILLIFLSIITLGIYPMIWHILRIKEFDKLRTKSKPSYSPAIIMVVLYIFVLILNVTLILFTPATSNGQINNFSEIPIPFLVNFSLIIVLSFSLGVMMGVLAFKKRKILNEVIQNKGTKSKVSWLFTLIFNFLYIQYEINRIIDDKEEKRKVAPWLILALFAILIILLAILAYNSSDMIISSWSNFINGNSDFLYNVQLQID